MCTIRPSVRTPGRRSRGLMHHHPRPTPTQPYRIHHIDPQQAASIMIYHRLTRMMNAQSTKSTKGHMHQRTRGKYVVHHPCVAAWLSPFSLSRDILQLQTRVRESTPAAVGLINVLDTSRLHSLWRT
ncbi:unnamed protein product, partial [Ectocarpus sp. 12 AP-2014]